MAGVLYDSQFDDDNRVLRNKLGITDPEQLEPHIARLSFFRVAQVEHAPLTGKFDIPHLRRIHHHIFQDVFPWAGDFREVTTSRTNSFGFPPPQFLIPSLETLFNQLRTEDHLKRLDADRFAARAGYFLGELNAIHPFREGNGRTQREFIRSLAVNAGHKLSWRNLTPDENNTASKVSYATGNHTGLISIIRNRLT